MIWKKKPIDVSSPEFGWTTPQGTFVGRAHVAFQQVFQHDCQRSRVFQYGTPIVLRIYVYRLDEDGDRRTHFHLWESREVAKRDGNPLSEFDAWRMHATGYTPDAWMRTQLSFQRESARWNSAR
jgi:hypothetical protein